MIGYAALTRLLERAGAYGDPAEYHGTLSGVCAAAKEGDPQSWTAQALAAASSDAPPDAASHQPLIDVAREVHEMLGDHEFGFMPLLPEDDAPISERVAALARWCEGFLYGLTLADSEAMQALKGDAGEALEDFSKLTRASSHRTVSETDEQAYAELVEYVRVGVQLVFEELRGARRAD